MVLEVLSPDDDNTSRIQARESAASSLYLDPYRANSSLFVSPVWYIVHVGIPTTHALLLYTPLAGDWRSRQEPGN